jgi:hypothetical protein
MKKLFALLLALTLALSLAACGEKDNGSNSDVGNSSQGSVSGGSSLTDNAVQPDGNKQVVTKDASATSTAAGAKLTFTVWNGRHLYDGKSETHPGASAYNINFTTTHSQEDVLYVPFVIEMTNPADNPNGDIFESRIGATAGDSDYPVYIAAANDKDGYESKNGRLDVYITSSIKLGDTVKYIGYVETPIMTKGISLGGGGVDINIFFNTDGSISKIER